MLFKKRRNKQVIEIIIDSNNRMDGFANGLEDLQASEQTETLSGTLGSSNEINQENDSKNQSKENSHNAFKNNSLSNLVLLFVVSLIITMVYNSISTILLIHKHSLPYHLFSFVAYDIGDYLKISVLIFLVTLMSMQIVSMVLKLITSLLNLSNFNKHANYALPSNTIVLFTSLLIGGFIVYLLGNYRNSVFEVNVLVYLLIFMTSLCISVTYFLIDDLKVKPQKTLSSYTLMTSLCLVFMMSSSFAIYLSNENIAVGTSVTLSGDDDYENVYELISIKNDVALLKSNNFNTFKIYGIEDLIFHTYN